VADLAGYTALTQAHGDEHAADVACAFADAVRALADAYDADNVKSIGDAVLLRVPDPVDAIHVAARIVGELGAHDRSLGVCVGMDTGTAVERGGDWFGSAVNVATRVADLATSGQVLMTGVTRDAVAGAVLPGQIQPRGEHQFKNLPEPLPVFALVLAEDEAAQALPVDPVCRMAIDPVLATDRLDHEGVTYYFCSSECADAFRERAHRYTGR
jgi:class 3 adenylate cyclase/YHS domain-containing protein